MRKNMELIKKQLRENNKLMLKVMKSLENAPDGNMKCEMYKGKYPQYYVTDLSLQDSPNQGATSQGTTSQDVTNQDAPNPSNAKPSLLSPEASDIKTARSINASKKKRYLKKGEREQARLYAQKDYDLRMLKLLKKQDKALRDCLIAYSLETKMVYEKLNIARKQLVLPYVLPDEEYIKEWEASFERNGNTIPAINCYLTERGERVRSKSEKILADSFYRKGIPYVYEPTLILGTNIKVFPDFAVLNVRERSTYYWEHFGMMDSPEYCKKALEKNDIYMENGFYNGENIIYTMESSEKGIDIRQIDALAVRYLL